MVNISITGFWTSKAGDVNPQKKISTPQSDDTFFCRISHDGKPNDAIFFEVLLDSNVAYSSYDYLSNDGREDVYFRIPLKYRTVGNHEVQFVARSYDVQTRTVGEVIYQSDKFSLEYT